MSKFRNSTLAAALVMLLATLVAGCGGGSSDSESTAADRDTDITQQRPGSEQQAELRECLERNGADLPSPPEGGQGGPPEGGMPPIGGGQGGPPGGGDPSEFRDALEKCGVDPDELPDRPGGSGGPPMGDSLDDFVACVRENGYDLPEPNTSGDGPVFDPSEVDQDDPDFKKASQACQDELRPSAPH